MVVVSVADAPRLSLTLTVMIAEAVVGAGVHTVRTVDADENVPSVADHSIVSVSPSGS
jgi:hypothetical protein